ncbi:MAG: hypothetical protein FJ225_12445 [Lentisphaerae bacterium]|nr:hypothetical protein [Lentisphaerota bacterium]
MAITPFQSGILRILAVRRRENGESYVAGGVALNLLLETPRRSRDIDLFHDTGEALAATWASDRETLKSAGYEVTARREALSFVDARVSKGGDSTSMQWARDSAYRFFPLMEDPLMGLTLHPFDLATNKVLAMAGRVEVRDWIDVLNCNERLQPFGYLIWAACGKDPGYNPRSLLAVAGRLHYSHAEVNTLDFGGQHPDAAALGRKWHEALEAADAICRLLPAKQVGTCVLSKNRELYRGDPQALAESMEKGAVLFHSGRIGGSWPSIPGEETSGTAHW